MHLPDEMNGNGWADIQNEKQNIKIQIVTIGNFKKGICRGLTRNFASP